MSQALHRREDTSDFDHKINCAFAEVDGDARKGLSAVLQEQDSQGRGEIVNDFRSGVFPGRIWDALSENHGVSYVALDRFQKGAFRAFGAPDTPQMEQVKPDMKQANSEIGRNFFTQMDALSETWGEHFHHMEAVIKVLKSLSDDTDRMAVVDSLVSGRQDERLAGEIKRALKALPKGAPRQMVLSKLATLFSIR